MREGFFIGYYINYKIIAMKLKFLFAVVALATSLTMSALAGKKSDPMTAMSFNIRYDNPSDAPNHWDNRKEWVAGMIHYYQPDVVGLQEVLVSQLNDLKAMLPDYGVIGCGRDDGKEQGEYSAILYHKSKLVLLDEKTLWLSQTPEKPGSMGWDAVCNRVLTKGVFKVKNSGKQLVLFNTHFDHVGQEARRESALMVKREVGKYADKFPVMVMGDFNADPASNVYRLLVEDSPLMDALGLASYQYGPQWTFHGFGSVPVAERPRIDYVFVTSRITVLKHLHLSDQRGDRFPSDHLPVIVEFGMK